MNIVDTALIPPHTISNAFSRAALSHGFFGRKGGVSDGYFESLNTAFGPDDDAQAGGTLRDRLENILENRNRIARAVGLSAGENIASLRQVQGSRVFTVSRAFARADRPFGDGLVSDVPGVGISVLTADCAPVLFYAPDGRHGVIGAAHAGREGALAGVLESTVLAMSELGARCEEITAVIGPCIGPHSYQLQYEDGRAFYQEDPASGQYFEAERDGHTYMDLPGYCAFRLARAGVRNIHVIAHDTAARTQDYFSYRRSTNAGEPARGLQMSVIALNP